MAAAGRLRVRRPRGLLRMVATALAAGVAVLGLMAWVRFLPDYPGSGIALGAAACGGVLILWRRLGRGLDGSAASHIRRSTLVMPGASDAELVGLAGAVLFYRRQAQPQPLTFDLDARITALLWRGASFVVMAERGAGPATRHALERCATAIARYASFMSAGSGTPLGTERLRDADALVDLHLLNFLRGPNAPLIQLVEAIAPELDGSARAHVARALEELMRDLAEQFNFGRRINP